MKAYVKSEQFNAVFSSNFTFQLTYAVLATFTFVSGFLAYRTFDNLADVGRYYGKRLVRIYPLFALSCVLMGKCQNRTFCKCSFF